MSITSVMSTVFASAFPTLKLKSRKQKKEKPDQQQVQSAYDVFLKHLRTAKGYDCPSLSGKVSVTVFTSAIITPKEGIKYLPVVFHDKDNSGSVTVGDRVNFMGVGFYFITEETGEQSLSISDFKERFHTKAFIPFHPMLNPPLEYRGEHLYPSACVMMGDRA